MLHSNILNSDLLVSNGDNGITGERLTKKTFFHSYSLNFLIERKGRWMK
jgi:hypothetical protein